MKAPFPAAMLSDNQRLVVFSDLDGCLLNKSDYDFSPAIPVLNRLRRERIPIVLASSKTETEMRSIAAEMELADAPLICENGGTILWSRNSAVDDPENRLILGAPREQILEFLKKLKKKFKFRSFRDLQVSGVASATNLPTERAEAALLRSSTEPLLWDDEENLLTAMQAELEAAGYTFTRGGRFWHVAGQTSKGHALRTVVERLKSDLECAVQTIAIGDSPIDQSMLDEADFPIAIPSPDGLVHVGLPDHNGRTASKPGAAGWAEVVDGLLDVLKR